MSLSPGTVLPKDMDQRQFARWCRDQELVGANSVATSAIQGNAVTFAKIQKITADTVLGRLSTDGDVTELDAENVVSLVEGEDWSFSGTVDFSGNIGFFGETPVGQQTAPQVLSMTTISGSGADSDINDNFLAIQTAVNQLRTDLIALGLIG